MRSKLTLSLEKEINRKAKVLAAKNETTVSAMFANYIEIRSRPYDKLQALHDVSGIVYSDLSAGRGDDYRKKIWEKHGW